MITSNDLELIRDALITINVHGQQDIETMNNIFHYLKMLIQQLDNAEVQTNNEEVETDG